MIDHDIQRVNIFVKTVGRLLRQGICVGLARLDDAAQVGARIGGGERRRVSEIYSKLRRCPIGERDGIPFIAVVGPLR